MEIGIVKITKDAAVTDAALEEIADALDQQSRDDVAVFRQTGYVPCRYYPSATASVDVASGAVTTKGLPDGVAPHLVLDYPTDQGELGDHYVTGDGLPILRSFWGPTKDSGGDLMGPTGLSTVMSHENTEADEDPYANLWAQLPDDVARSLGAKKFALEAFEACDRCESFSYQRSGVRPFLSDFLSTRAARPALSLTRSGAERLPLIMALLPLALAALVGAGATKLWDRFKTSKIQSVMAPLPGGAPTAQATVLQNGRVYSADMLVDPSGFPTKDPQNNAQPIADALGSVGMTILAPPQPRDPANSALFQQGQPARMFTLFRWQNADGAPGALPGFIKQVNFYQEPAAV